MAMNNKDITVAVFNDFKKAFDTVDHSILLRKIDLCGIRHANLKLLNSYISHRKQHTLFNSIMSDMADISCGVPIQREANHAVISLQKDLDQIACWCWLLVLVTKSKKKKIPTICLMLQNERLAVVDSYRYLGLFLDSTLLFEHHLKSLLKNVSHRLYLLTKIHRFLTPLAAEGV